MVPSARTQFASIRRRFKPLPQFLQVWPAHGAGSVCGKSLGDVPTSTVGYELRHNRSIRAAEDEQTFVDFILAGQPEPPAYFARMKHENRRGARLLGDLPVPSRIEAGAIAALAGRRDVAVLNTRPRQAFFAGHLQGASSRRPERGVHGHSRIVCRRRHTGVPVVEDTRVTDVVRALVRVGLDCVAGYLTPQMLDAFARSGGSLARTKTIDIATMETMRVAGQGRVLDVRGASEFEADHVPGAIHIPHTRLAANHGELPRNARLLVHCSSGVRTASAVSSFLERLGYEAFAVDDSIRRISRGPPVARSGPRIAFRRRGGGSSDPPWSRRV